MPPAWKWHWHTPAAPPCQKRSTPPRRRAACPPAYRELAVNYATEASAGCPLGVQQRHHSVRSGGRRH
ncbi:hypothetical protein CHLRE_05g243358v5 [Chlamydomonas reinhardtii]|uniref:Uncharacterized protein n=1 Tax=Chlamydomonas reinhardtii TaxID=3055 RepID=A0A2K3DT93_CHLRE|nr:uncharacterized protein CHLRE_05g243358v5 [Chlamydomonas reinhardtii]PNW83745.1 hypothetical protein CHLRE_05g243358v5 [Chlamydomonas reinhardtii]